MNKILLIILSILLLNYILHLRGKEKTRKLFPKNIILDIDLDIELPNIEWKKDIPKNIYRTHKSKKDVLNYQEVLNKTEELLSDYKTHFYYEEDIEEFIKDKFSERIYKAYKYINPEYGPAKADFFRYLIIFYYGGIYLDIKSGPTKNIDKIIKKLEGKMAISNWINLPIGYLPINHIDDLYFSSFVENNYGEYQNWYIISGKGNPILAKIIKQMVSNIEKGKDEYTNGHKSVIAMTGPLMMTKIIEKYHNKEEVVFFKANLDDHLKYKIIDHKIIEKNNHYSNKKNKNVLL